MTEVLTTLDIKNSTISQTTILSSILTKPKRQEVKVTEFQTAELKGVYWWTALYFKIGYYTAAGPFGWNLATNKGERVTSKWHKICEAFNLIVVTTSSFLQFWGLAMEVSNGDLQISNIATPYLIGAFMMTGYTVVFQIHTAAHTYDVNAFNNHAMDYLQFVAKEGLFKNPKKFDRICSIGMAAMLVGCCCPIIFAAGTYLASCDFHILAKTLPTCAEGNRHRSGPWILFYVFVSIYTTTQNVGAATTYLGAITLSTMGCRYILDSMTEDIENAEGSVGKLRDPHRWYLHYNCLQMVFNRMNICMGKFILPFLLTFILIIVVTINYGIFVLEFSPIIAYGISLNFLFIGGTSAALYQGALFVEMTENILQMQKTSCTSHRIWFAKVIRSCKKLEVNVGPYFTIGKTTFMEYLNQILDHTINIVLSFPKEELDEVFNS